MEVKFSKQGTTLIICIIGELDHHSAEYIRHKIDSEILKATIKNAIFDFSKLSFIDSSGLGVIMGRYKNVQQLNGKVAVVNINAQTKRIIEMSGILKLIPEYDSIDTAINNM